MFDDRYGPGCRRLRLYDWGCGLQGLGLSASGLQGFMALGFRVYGYFGLSGLGLFSGFGVSRVLEV